MSVRAGASGCTPISFCQRCHFVFSIASRRAYSDLWFEIRGKNEFQLISGSQKDVLLSLILTGRREYSFILFRVIANLVTELRNAT